MSSLTIGGLLCVDVWRSSINYFRNERFLFPQIISWLLIQFSFSKQKIFSFFLMGAFFVVVLILTRQVPLKGLSSLMNLALLGFFGMQGAYIIRRHDRSRLLFLFLFVAWCCFLLAYSAIAGNSMGNIFRFMTILVLIQAAFFIKPDPFYIKVFLWFLTIQAVFLIGLHLILNLFFNLTSYTVLRMFFQAQGWGDLYTYNGVFYNIQILGNALLPFGVFVSLIHFSGIKRVMITGILVLGMLVAGNFAFVLGLVVFLMLVFFTTKQFKTRKFLASALIGMVSVGIIAKPAFQYLENTISKKSQESNPTRLDQSIVLWTDLEKNPISMVFGQGVGNTVDAKTKWRDYTDNIYFELQSLYFLNQMGLLNFLIFVICNVLCVILYFRKPIVKIIYTSYILYALFNPYFLDTSHIVVIVVLISLNHVLEERDSLQLQPNEL